jgi:ligand-binding sensor domain-containing protein/signal transduction histidine kinase
MKAAPASITVTILIFLLSCALAFALDPSPKFTRYSRATWIRRAAFSVGAILGDRTGLRHSTSETKAGSPRRRSLNIPTHSGHMRVSDLKFTHLTTKDGLSQGYVTAILQDRRGFMWFATRDGLNRYDGNAFLVYKSDPSDPNSPNSNFIQGLMEDNHGYLWLATNTGVDKFDPTTERFTRYLHDPKNPSIGGALVKSIAQDSSGHIWLGTEDAGLDELDPTSGRFTHYRNDSDGDFVGRITQVIADRQGDIWFVGEHGLFHLNSATGQITRPPAIRNGFSAESVYEDETGNLWMLVDSPVVELVKYDPQMERSISYPLPTPAVVGIASTTNGGSANSTLAPDARNGLWVPSSLGLYYFDRQTGGFTLRFQHDETNPDSLDSNAILSVYQDRGGVLWVGTENAGLNVLSFQQEQFVTYRHRPGDPESISAGRVKGIYQEADGSLWLGFFPLALDKLNRKTGQITHYASRPGDENALGKGTNIDAIYRDAAGYLWVGGGGNGVNRFDERTGRFSHYRHIPNDPHSLISNNVYAIYGDRSGNIWVGQDGGISRYDPPNDGFINYLPVPDNPAILVNTVWVIYQDRSGILWLGTWGGALSRFDEKRKTFVNQLPNPQNPHSLHGGGVNTIHEDRSGTLWVGSFDGLYRYNRENETFTRYTEGEGLPSSTIRCILEDGVGRLWLSTDKGISRFDPARQTFRNYDASDGLQGNEFSTGCYQGRDGQMFFGGTDGFNAFRPEAVHDNPYVPAVVITSFRIFNKPVPIGAKSVLTKAIPYADSLTLPYRDNVFSFEFAALSYANSNKNRYRYKLQGFEAGWNEVGSNQRLATYTNLDPGKYVFRVQGSNSDGVWNEEGAFLSILITPPWWGTNWFRALCAVTFLAVLWATYQLRVRKLRHQFEMTLEARVGERTRIARELHDTLLQKFQGLLPRFQAAVYTLPQGAVEARKTLEAVVDLASEAITEGRDAVQGLRMSTLEKNDLGLAIRTVGEELAGSNQSSPTFDVIVQGTPRNLHPILRDEVYRITAEALRNAFRHAQAREIEAEIEYGEKDFTIHVRDDGTGIDREVLSSDGREGHFGLHGMRERAELVGGKFTVWSEAESGTEIELSIPASKAYVKSPQRVSLFRKLSSKDPHLKEKKRS